MARGVDVLDWASTGADASANERRANRTIAHHNAPARLVFDFACPIARAAFSRGIEEKRPPALTRRRTLPLIQPPPWGRDGHPLGLAAMSFRTLHGRSGSGHLPIKVRRPLSARRYRSRP